MTIFQWEPKLELGIDLIDQQHKQLLSYANSFFIQHCSGNAQQSARESIAFLQQYILYHFQAEEAFQVECSYPSYRSHQAQHSFLAMQVKAHQVRLEASDFAPDSIEAFYRFFMGWISNHIMEDDLAFALFYKAHKG